MHGGIGLRACIIVIALRRDGHREYGDDNVLKGL